MQDKHPKPSYDVDGSTLSTQTMAEREADEERNEAASAFTSARQGLEITRDAVQHRFPNLPPPAVELLTGDATSARLDHDLEQAQRDGIVSPAEAELLEADALAVTLEGTTQDTVGISIKENALTDAERTPEKRPLVTHAVETAATSGLMSLPELQHMARTVDEAGGEADREKQAAARIAKLEANYERTFTAELGAAFGKLLAELSLAEQQLIHSNPLLRDSIRHAIGALGLDHTLGVDAQKQTGEYEGQPETMKHAHELVASAERVNAGFQERMADIAARSGSSYKPGPIKRASRVAEKADKDYDGEVELVRDAVRGRITIEGDPRIDDAAIIERVRAAGYEIAINEETGQEIIKRGYVDALGRSTSLKQRRYMDTKVTVMLRDPETQKKTLAEIVIATPEMAAATKAEHPVYEIIRSLKAKDRATNDQMSDLRARLRELSGEFYASASGRLSARLSSLEKGGS